MNGMGGKASESSSVSPRVHTLALENCREHFRQPKSQFSSETNGLDPSSSFLSLKNESERSKETSLLLISTLWISLPGDILYHFSSCRSCLVRQYRVMTKLSDADALNDSRKGCCGSAAIHGIHLIWSGADRQPRSRSTFQRHPVECPECTCGTFELLKGPTPPRISQFPGNESPRVLRENSPSSERGRVAPIRFSPGGSVPAPSLGQGSTRSSRSCQAGLAQHRPDKSPCGALRGLFPGVSQPSQAVPG